MTGEIIKIKKDNFKDGKGYWVFFKLENGKTARTYLVKSFGNFKRWLPYLTVGRVVDGLIWKNKKNRLIDADSIISEKIDLKKMAELGIFG